MRLINSARRFLPAAISCLLLHTNAFAAESVAHQIERLENTAQDCDQAKNYPGAAKAIDEALRACSSLNHYNEKVTELRARHLRYMILNQQFSQFKPEMSALNKDAVPIEKSLRTADAVVELNELHAALLQYAMQNHAEDAFKLDLELTENFKKCNFSPTRVIIQFAKFYIAQGNYKALAELGRQFNQFDRDRSVFGHYIIFLSMDKTGKKKEAAAYLKKELAWGKPTEYGTLYGEVQLATAMVDALQYDDALNGLAAVMKKLQPLETQSAAAKDAKAESSYLRLESECKLRECAIYSARKNFTAVNASSKAGQKLMDKGARCEPQQSHNQAFKDRYKELQAFEESALRAQGKEAEANQLRADRFKRRFGMVIE